MDLNKLKGNRKLWYIIIFAVVAVFIVGNKRFRTLVERRIELTKLRKELKELLSEDARLRKNIYMLEGDNSYIEYLIRRDLGYLKQNEFEYRFIKEETASKK
jgi:cell division protein FtsB